MSTRITDSVIDEDLKPTCSICNKDVDRMSHFINIMYDEVVMIVECHGEQDKCSLNIHEFQEMILSFKIGKGRAFDKPLLGQTRQIEHKT